MKNLYLIEFYTRNPKTGEGGWDINFAWVYAADAREAREKNRVKQGARYSCAIQTTQHSEIFPLGCECRVNTKDANLFILN